MFLKLAECHQDRHRPLAGHEVSQLAMVHDLHMPLPTPETRYDRSSLEPQWTDCEEQQRTSKTGRSNGR